MRSRRGARDLIDLMEDCAIVSLDVLRGACGGLGGVWCSRDLGCLPSLDRSDGKRERACDTAKLNA